MFRLTRVYSIASLLGIAVVAVTLGAFYRAVAVDTMMEHENQFTLELTQSLSSEIGPNYRALIAGASKMTPGELSKSPELASLNREVQNRIRGLPVAKIKIFDLNGLTVFSTDPAEIGKAKSANDGFKKAAAGHSASQVVFRSQFASLDQIISDRNLLESYVPLHGPGGRVEGVFELYSDVSLLIQEIEQTGHTILAVVATLMLLLYLFLSLIVHRADRLIRQQEEAQREVQQERMNYLTYHDGLTGLPNRSLFMELLRNAIKRSKRSHRLLGLMFLDLDRFKLINDSLGQDAGDQIIAKSAHRIGVCVRDGDTPCRMGADQFAVILENLSSGNEAALVAERFIREFSTPVELGGHEIVISASIGIAIYPTDTSDTAHLLNHAEAAMTKAKELGGNRHVFYTEDLNGRTMERLQYELGLRKALQNREFVLHYQARVDAETGTVIGMEALLRWQHQKLGLVPPDRFIPLLEDTGLIVPVGEWVIGEACRQCKEWQAAGHSPLRVSVNISLRQFCSDSLVASVAQALRESGLPPHRLELELTESILAEDTSAATALLQEMRKIGVYLSIDDFGTGYSSLSYLRHFPINYLKIDRSFIREVTTNPDDSAITAAIAAMAKSLNLGVVAEGVETSDQAHFLRSIGCDEMQGYLYGKPLPAADFEALLRQSAESGQPRNIAGLADPAPG